jgi:hypothetical protein
MITHMGLVRNELEVQVVGRLIRALKVPFEGCPFFFLNWNELEEACFGTYLVGCLHAILLLPLLPIFFAFFP